MFASPGVGPKAACSRKRRAAAEETSAFATPICTANGAEVAEPLLTVTLPAPDKLAKPVTVRTPLEKVVPSGVPFKDATDDDMKPVPVIVIVKIPSGSCPFVPTPVIAGVGGVSVTVAVPLPLGPVAVTVSVPPAGIADGAVYRPLLVTVPYVAAHAVAPAEVNGCVAPKFKETVSGEMTCALASVTVAEADPLGPIAVTVTVLDEGMVEGAVYMPLALIAPADAVQEVAPAEVNCWVAPRFRETLAGEMAGALTSDTAATADPPGPVAVMLTLLEAGIVEGAIYRPLALIAPAVAVQEVAPDDVNCLVAPRFTDAEVGTMVCAGVAAANVALNAGPHKVPGFST